MSVAIRAITQIQEADDAPVLGAGQDGYALTWDNASGAFVATALSAGVTDHGALTGLTPDDDHTQYALLAGRAGGQTLYGGTAANDDITIHGTSDATRTTSYVLLQPTAGNVGIGTTAPSYGKLDVAWDGQGGIASITMGANDLGGTSTRTNSTNKVATIGSVHRLSAEEPVCMLMAVNLASQNIIAFGGGTSGLNAATDIYFYTGATVTTTLGTARMRIDATGLVGIGTTAPATLLHGLLTSAATNAVTNVVTIGHDTTGTAANGFGAGLLYQLESSTTAAQDAAQIAASWTDATHATRTSKIDFRTVTSAAALATSLSVIPGGIVTAAMRPAADSTTALQLQNAAGTAVVTVDTTNNRLSLPFGVVYSGSSQLVRFDAVNANIFLGASGNASVSGINNTGIGDNALVSLTSGANNFGSGYGALYSNSTGSNNYALGIMAMAYATNPSAVVAVGNYSGMYATGGNSVFIGYMAGNHETGTQRLYIDSFDRTDEATGRISSLLYGEFNLAVASQLLRVNGILQSLMTDAATNTVTTHLKVSHNTSGTAAAGFGSGVLWELKSSTTADQSAARVQALWYEATHASRKADLVLTAFDTAEREGLRIRGAGSGPAIGFYGVSPIERATLATGAGASVDDVITALQNLGLVKQS